jgi:hypothetical protein
MKMDLPDFPPHLSFAELSRERLWKWVSAMIGNLADPKDLLDEFSMERFSAPYPDPPAKFIIGDTDCEEFWGLPDRLFDPLMSFVCRRDIEEMGKEVAVARRRLEMAKEKLQEATQVIHGLTEDYDYFFNYDPLDWTGLDTAAGSLKQCSDLLYVHDFLSRLLTPPISTKTRKNPFVEPDRSKGVLRRPPSVVLM